MLDVEKTLSEATSKVNGNYDSLTRLSDTSFQMLKKMESLHRRYDRVQNQLTELQTRLDTLERVEFVNVVDKIDELGNAHGRFDDALTNMNQSFLQLREYIQKKVS